MMPMPNSEQARQETGAPSRCEDLAAGSQLAVTDIEARIMALEALATSELRIEWRRLYRATPPTRLSRDLLLRGIAYMVQERAHGGLSLSTKRRLRSLCEGSDQRGGPTAGATLKPGTKLVREWHRQVHTVSVLDEGFEYQGERYRSLTRIARRITGVPWSGPRFFGISKRRRAADHRGAVVGPALFRDQQASAGGGRGGT
jgi:hypothetical protein